MTEKQLKELVEWMRDSGVQQFQYDKKSEVLAVSFSPKAVRAPVQMTSDNNKQALSSKDSGFSVADMMPAMPDTNLNGDA